jgi:methionyl-tRNA formyltransferase
MLRWSWRGKDNRTTLEFIMKSTVICSDASHPVMRHLIEWKTRRSKNDQIEIVQTASSASGGDFLFLVSCSDFIGESIRSRYRYSIVLHASDLPNGKGWSPHIWEIISGAEEITLSAIDAEDEIDTGAIWKQICIPIPKDALHDEINEILFSAEIQLMDDVIGLCLSGNLPLRQADRPSSYYRRRTPADSEIDPHKTIVDQFNLLRVCDPERFPAFFHLNGHVYTICLRKVDADGECNQD